MKVSEAIDQLEVGETVWVKGKVLEIDDTKQPLYASVGTGGYKWLFEDDEITLTEPQAEKVEVKQCVAEFYEANKDDLNFAIYEAVAHSIKECGYKAYPEGFMDWLVQSSNNPIETLIRMKDGYTVKPKRWVVKRLDCGANDMRLSYFLHGTVDPVWALNGNPMVFTDRAKAEAVAVLVEGSVEEV